MVGGELRRTETFANSLNLGATAQLGWLHALTGKSGRLTYFKDGDVVIVEGSGSGAGNAVTAHGKSGVLGDSGAAALGGAPTDPGKPVLKSDIESGTVPVAPGDTPLAPAPQSWP